MKKIFVMIAIFISFYAHADIEAESFKAIKSYAADGAGELSYAENYLFEDILDQKADMCIHEANFLAISYKDYEMSAYEVVAKNNQINTAREYPDTLSEAELYRVVYSELSNGANKAIGLLEEYQFRLSLFKYCVR